jgi:hypothetical protein
MSGRSSLSVREHAAVERNQNAESLLKLAFEKCFLWKARNGYINLP